MTEEEKLKVYRDGFKDGFDEGYKRGRLDGDLLNPYKEVLKNYQPHINVSCPVCGRTGISGVVCSVPNCPTTAYSGPIGAAGSSIRSTMPTGANGPVEPGGVW